MAARIDSAVARAWAEFYLEGVAAHVAEERRDELASDVHEHRSWARTRGVPDWRVHIDIASRTLRGVAADLAWRRAVRSGSASERGPIASLTLTAAVLTVAVFGIALSAFALASALVTAWFVPRRLSFVAVAGALLFCALLLVRRPRLRLAGVAWLAVGGVLAIENAPMFLLDFWPRMGGAGPSGSALGGFDRLLIGYVIQQIAAAVVLLLCASAVVAWWPVRRTGAQR
ncbi:hypothetical protein HQQ81_06845 [Microbacteriaceae bacterium VKM Ac-2854]|nr:hypothetical protein [Microbacteriaceae bacterium VKM Ac-2854]